MFSLKIFLFMLLSCFSICKAQIFALSTTGGLVQLWNQTTPFLTLQNDNNKDNFLSFLFNEQNNVLLTGTQAGKIYAWNIKDNTKQGPLIEKADIFEMQFVNDTHFAVAYPYYIVVIGGKNYTDRKEYTGGGYGQVRCLKVLRKERQILFGSIDKATLFILDLNTGSIMAQVKLSVNIYSIDALNKEFIATECYKEHACIHRINGSTISEIKRIPLAANIWSIKILNEKFIVLGCDTYLGLWDSLNNNLYKYTKVSESAYYVLAFDYFGNDTIGVIEGKTGNIDLWKIGNNLTYLKSIKQNGDADFAIKSLIDSTFFDNQKQDSVSSFSITGSTHSTISTTITSSLDSSSTTSISVGNDVTQTSYLTNIISHESASTNSETFTTTSTLPVTLTTTTSTIFSLSSSSTTSSSTMFSVSNEVTQTSYLTNITSNEPISTDFETFTISSLFATSISTATTTSYEPTSIVPKNNFETATNFYETNSISYELATIISTSTLTYSVATSPTIQQDNPSIGLLVNSHSTSLSTLPTSILPSLLNLQETLSFL